MKRITFYLVLMMVLVACQATDNLLEDDEVFQKADYYAPILNAAQKGIQMLEEDKQTRSVSIRTINKHTMLCKTSPSSRSVVDTLYFIVNYADSRGFAIVSADRAKNCPLLAVVDNGSYDPNEATGNTGFDMFISMLDAYSKQEVDMLPETDPLPIIRTEMYYTPWITSQPKLNVNWGQGSVYGLMDCYNYFCPLLNGYRAPTGCVATAIAMIMSFYEWPDTLSLTYVGRDQNEQTLDWEDVKSHYDNRNCYGFGGVDHLPLARLMRQIGHLVNMDYYIDSSGNPVAGAFSENVPAALQQLGYITTGSLHDYTWGNVRSDIDAGHVIYMRGKAYINKMRSGHAWVVDGYKTQSFITEYYQANQFGREVLVGREQYDYNYLHINWGWDGNNNGYFVSDVFNTSSPNSFDSDVYPNTANFYFVEDLDIITGIRINN